MPIVARPKQVIRDYCRHKKHRSGPIYFLIHEEKIDLHKHYTVQLSIDGAITAQGTGLSRRIAEFKAALNAINIISQDDPSILDHIKTDKYGRTINRSYSVDYISNSNRSDSFTSMVSGHYPSTTTSIDGIDSMNVKNGYPTLIPSNVDDNPKEKHNDGETSSDEGVFVEGSESSSAVPSPKLQTKRSMASKFEEEKSLKKSDSKSKFNFFNSLTLLSSLRAFSRRSFRRKSLNEFKNSSLDNNPGKNEESSNVSRPTSSSSSSTSSAFSSNSSISSSTPPTSSSNSDEISKSTEEPSTMMNSLINESILEEDEEEINDDTSNNIRRDDNPDINDIKNHSYGTFRSGDSSSNNHVKLPLLRSLSTSYSLANVCSHNHFSIYGPLLCRSTSDCSNNDSKSITIEFCTSLLRYCVRMYLPLPYYDIQFNKKFLVTCRIIICPEKTKISKQPVLLPEKYLNNEFTAKGNGDVLKDARNMAAQAVIEKLKTAAGLEKELNPIKTKSTESGNE